MALLGPFPAPPCPQLVRCFSIWEARAAPPPALCFPGSCSEHAWVSSPAAAHTAPRHANSVVGSSSPGWRGDGARGQRGPREMQRPQWVSKAKPGHSSAGFGVSGRMFHPLWIVSRSRCLSLHREVPGSCALAIKAASCFAYPILHHPEMRGPCRCSEEPGQDALFCPVSPLLPSGSSAIGVFAASSPKHPQVRIPAASSPQILSLHPARPHAARHPGANLVLPSLARGLPGPLGQSMAPTRGFPCPGKASPALWFLPRSRGSSWHLAARFHFTVSPGISSSRGGLRAGSQARAGCFKAILELDRLRARYRWRLQTRSLPLHSPRSFIF